ncbi:ParB N-terminal domain-containing protein [Pseudooceanicola sp. C21-150M6]|uniref:ParB N-terminal domain-containing protein n=1 Tax=Pseudooceanicola sp. C21-150M6 TaxID=3434355 RepID=UPI003D7F51B0
MLEPLDLSLFDGVVDRSQWSGLTAPASGTVDLLMVPVSQLAIDRDYQRRVSDNGRSRIVKIVKGFSWARFGALIVSETAGDRLAIVDGQHRAIAAALLGVEAVPAVVVRQTEVARQAMDFVGINTVRTTVASIDKFRARVAAGDADAVQVAETLDELTISTDVPAGMSLRPRETRAVATLEKMQKRFGRGVVFTTLETLIEAQPDVSNLLTAFAIEATAIVVHKMIDAERDLERLDPILADTDFETLKAEAAQLVKLTGGQTAPRGAELLLKHVNKGLREKVA